MANLKLPKLPDRTPVKLTISVTPDLHRALLDYTTIYADAYGEQENMVDLIPFMLSSFLENDRAFLQARREKAGGGKRDDDRIRLAHGHAPQPRCLAPCWMEIDRVGSRCPAHRGLPLRAR